MRRPPLLFPSFIFSFFFTQSLSLLGKTRIHPSPWVTWKQNSFIIFFPNTTITLLHPRCRAAAASIPTSPPSLAWMSSSPPLHPHSLRPADLPALPSSLSCLRPSLASVTTVPPSSSAFVPRPAFRASIPRPDFVPVVPPSPTASIHRYLARFDHACAASISQDLIVVVTISPDLFSIRHLHLPRYTRRCFISSRCADDSLPN
ncbi:hypothetical protein LINPERPRIM_LOCUS998 [Linum perenne]